MSPFIIKIRNGTQCCRCFACSITCITSSYGYEDACRLCAFFGALCITLESAKACGKNTLRDDSIVLSSSKMRHTVLLVALAISHILTETMVCQVDQRDCNGCQKFIRLQANACSCDEISLRRCSSFFLSESGLNRSRSEPRADSTQTFSSYFALARFSPFAAFVIRALPLTMLHCSQEEITLLLLHICLCTIFVLD